MRATTDLTKLSASAGCRVRKLRALVTSAASTGDADQHIARAVIEAHNTWCNFLRAYLLSYLVAPRNRLGVRVRLQNLAIGTPGDLLHAAVKACRGPAAQAPTERRDEPAWHDIQNFLRACAALNPTNLAHVHAVLSSQTRVFSDLPTFRNFYAHRNEETAARAINLARRYYLITGVRHPTEALLRPARRRPQPLLMDWLDEMTTVMEFLCE